VQGSLDSELIKVGEDISFSKKETMMPRDNKSTLISRNNNISSIVKDKKLVNDEFQNKMNFTNDSLDMELMNQVIILLNFELILNLDCAS